MQSMTAVLAPETEKLPAGRYHSLIRLADAIRASQRPSELFQILVQELANVVPFDAMAQFDEDLNKIHWHLGAACSYTKPPCDLPKEETIAWWVQEHQEILVVASVET